LARTCQNIRMARLVIVLVVLIAATILGALSQRKNGRFFTKRNFTPAVAESEIGHAFGTKGTVLQFSSAFCAPCRAARITLESVVPQFEGIARVEIDAEANLELVRKLRVAQTPTTIFLDAKGIELGRAVGAPKKSQLVAVLEKI